MTKVRHAAHSTFRSLAVRNYRLFFFGQLVSLTGTWMQSVAQVELVLKLTHNDPHKSFAVGLVVALQFLPMLLFGAWGGLMADRLDKRKALIGTQAWMAVVATGLAVFTFTGIMQLWMVYGFALLMGLGTVIDNPTRQAFVIEMVGGNDVANAVGLNSAVFNGARIAGPALAGLMIGGLHAIWPCFALNAVSFLAVIGGLYAMRPAELHTATRVAKAKGQIREGLRYVWTDPVRRSTILLVAVIGTFGLNFTVFLPLMAHFAFHKGATLFGLLTSALAVGSLVGALVTAGRGKPTPTLLAGSGVVFGFFMLCAAIAPSTGWELVALPLTGVGVMTFMATANSTLQLGSSSEMRGRVMALYALVFLGTTPLGGPLVSRIAEAYGPRVSMGFGAVMSLGASLVAGAVLIRKARRLPVDAALAPVGSQEPAAA
jgi:MFS family permease